MPHSIKDNGVADAVMMNHTVVIVIERVKKGHLYNAVPVRRATFVKWNCPNQSGRVVGGSIRKANHSYKVIFPKCSVIGIVGAVLLKNVSIGSTTFFLCILIMLILRGFFVFFTRS